MSNFEILCVTMNQNDFTKITEMNIHSDVIFANQCDHTSFEETSFEGHKAKMISTETKGVGINRNLALMYASADICLFADDDVVYRDDVEELVTSEFDAHPDADIFIFHLDTTDPVRKQKKYEKTRKCGFLERMPWGGVRIAFRLDSVRKANLWFTTLFGGGCIFPSGEDSMWLTEAKKKGLKFYVSKETIGTVSFEQSTWFSGANDAYFYGKGAFYATVHDRLFWLWAIYFVVRTKNRTELSPKQAIRMMVNGRNGYRQMISFQKFNEKSKRLTKES